ncbi:alpha-L-rhamnosidase [Agromyces tardus]|uniref:alpha-L-rhamnosidase n=1 Tax=Agromyces tardus TaxID=2583849 RepID=A0A3M8AI00_9MICO|nr:family 78 glycoside hydrolase catalytic domain [Agromyces tardus]RNB50788.1 alpha-L-rhamnosidase [Agromyces tardus]
MRASARVSLRSRLLRAMIARGKNTAPIAATVAAAAAAEIDGRPEPLPTPFAVRGLRVSRTRIGDTTVVVLRPDGTPPTSAVLYLHGGGYIEDASIGTWQLVARLATKLGAEVWVPAYRLAPRSTAQTTVAAMVEIYRALGERWDPARATVAGDSAGGGLALATVQAAVAAGERAPALLGLFAPWVDLTMSDPAEQDTESDAMLDSGRLAESAAAYAGTLPRTDPRVSPLFGRMDGLPETWIITGGDDVLVHQSRRLRDALAQAGVPVTYLEDPGMIHVHVMLPVPEGKRSLGRFLRAASARAGASPVSDTDEPERLVMAGLAPRTGRRPASLVHPQERNCAMVSQWHASFISGGSPARPGDPASYFRREFAVAEGLRRATLLVTALGIVEPYLNGVRVGDEVLAPGWTSYRHRINVSSHDVTDLIAAGENAVGAIVGEGWAVGRLGWEDRRVHYADRPALFLQLELEYGDRTEVIGTGPEFRVGTGAVRANGIYDGETYDAPLEPEGWSSAGFDDSDWASAEPIEWNLEALEVGIAPPIRRIDELAPVEILTSPSGKTIVDVGQNISGWVRITLTGEAGWTITLRHAEALTPDGELEPESNRRADATDRYTLRGGAEETWEPRFTFHGFRYVEVDGWPGELSVDAVRAVVVHSEMTRTGWFETSDPLVTKLHANAVWSMRDNFVGIPTDCPQRDERMGWTGDINAFAPTATFLYDVRGVLGSWLQDLAVEQAERGYVPWVVPDILSTPSSPTALWSDVAVSLPWAMYQEYGDLDILRGSYDSMTAFIRQVEDLLDESGLWSSGFQFGDWLDPDAPADNPAGGKTDRHLVASAYLCKTTREMAETAGLLGKAEDAAHFAALADRVRRAFRREYVTESGRVVNESTTAYALAIAFGILDEDQNAKAGDRLAELVAKGGYKISTGFAGTPLVTDALSSTGHLDEAYLLLMEKECPSFLYPVTMGATTIWERWDSILPDGTLNATGMTSLNHYALGAVADWLHRIVGGLQRMEPGYRRIRIAPQPGGGLTSAHVAHDTVHGRAEVDWRIEDGEMFLDVTIPEGTSAEVVLPLHPAGVVEQAAPGSHSWRYALPEQPERPEYSMDTPLKTLADDPQVWRAITEVFQTHFPGIPLDGTAPGAAGMSLNVMLQYIPGAPPTLADEFRRALTLEGAR